jgi:hypothetical protein
MRAHFFDNNATAMSADQQPQSMSPASANSNSNAPRRERRNRWSLLDHLVDTVVTNFVQALPSAAAQAPAT